MKNQEVKKSMETKENESGRSMVEMLGVLAIMGVLAIGGIAGYRWAMDKYNANEILNEVRKRAVTASQQRILGHAINLSEYGDNTIQGHAVTAENNYNGDTSFFALTVSGIEKDICDKIIKEKIPFAVEEKVGEVVVGDDTTCAGGNSNTITFAFANTLDGEAALPDPACDGVDCPEGASCSKGRCICSGTGQEVCGTICCEPREMCSSDVGGCVDVTGCKSNADCKGASDCEDGCYCAIDAEYDWYSGSCHKNYTGTCTRLDAVKKAGDYNNHTFFRSESSTPMTWWSARNWCLAHDMKLVSLSDLGITGGYEDGSCSGTNCTGADWSGLKVAFGNSGYSDWTDDSYDSCFALYVDLYDGNVGYTNRYVNSYALCVK